MSCFIVSGHRFVPYNQILAGNQSAFAGKVKIVFHCLVLQETEETHGLAEI